MEEFCASDLIRLSLFKQKRGRQLLELLSGRRLITGCGQRNEELEQKDAKAALLKQNHYYKASSEILPDFKTKHALNYHKCIEQTNQH